MPFNHDIFFTPERYFLQCFSDPSTIEMFYLTFLFVVIAGTIESCPENKYSCGDGSCISISWLCDNEWDCYDGKDEKNCQDGIYRSPSVITPPPMTTEDQNYEACKLPNLPCPNGECISLAMICDGSMQCSDGSDEYGCPDTPREIYTEVEFTTGMLTYQTHYHTTLSPVSTEEDTTESVTDSSSSTPDYFDSGSGGSFCAGFLCENQICIEQFRLCNGVIDCSDTSDEKNCRGNPEIVHHQGNNNNRHVDLDCSGFRCRNQVCIEAKHICNGVDDCGDLSDETSCTNNPHGVCFELYCHNGGSCFQKNSSRHCGCTSGYEGNRCELLKAPVQHYSYMWIVILNCGALMILMIFLLVFGCRMNRNVDRMIIHFTKPKVNQEKACNIYEYP